MKKFKRILKIIGISAGSFILLIVLISGLTQTQFFKDRLRVIIASKISTNINGTLHLGTIKGNFLSGFSIDSLAIYDDQGIFITTGKIICQYEILPVFEKRLKMNYFIIEQPHINFIRGLDGKWNLSKIIKPSEETTTGKLDWILQFDDIELKNAAITLIDSISLTSPEHWNLPSTFFEYHNFSINDLSVTLSTIIKDKNIQAGVKHISCYSPQSEFELTHFKGDFTVSEKGITAKNTIIQTGKSYIEMDASMRGINLFQPLLLEDLEHDSTRLQLKAKDIDLGELKSFLPQIKFLDGSASINLSTSGEFGNLTINQLNMKTLGNVLNASGNIKNLHRPEQLYLDVYVDDSKIVPADVPKILPGLPIPSFKEKDDMKFTTIFMGKPINFKTQTTLHGKNTGFDINGSMDLESNPPQYDLTFKTLNLNLENYFNIGNIKTRLTTNGTIAGAGFSFDDLTTKLNLTIDSSYIQNIYLNPSQITATVSEHLINTETNLNSNKMKTFFNGQAEIRDGAIESMSGNLEITSFDFATLLEDPQYESDINLQGTFSGSGKTLNDLNANIDFSLFPSSFRGHNLNSGIVTLSLDQSSREMKHLKIESPISDVSIDGQFELSPTIKAVIHQTDNLIKVIKEHATPETTFTVIQQKKDVKLKRNLPQESINLKYKLKVKDLDPIASVISTTPFNAQANLEGKLLGSENNLSISCYGTFDEFFVGTTKGGALLKNGTVDAKLDSLSDFQTLEHLVGNARISIDSGLINTKRVSGVNMDLDYRSAATKFTGQITLDSVYNLSATGNISVQAHTYAMDFDSLIFACEDRIWRNNQDVQLRLNNEGLRIMHANLQRASESVSLTGAIYSGGIFDLNASARNFDLNGLGILFRNPQLADPENGLTGKVNADLNLKGTSPSPEIKFHADGNNIYFHQTRIGIAAVSIDYENQKATIDLTSKQNHSDSMPAVMIRGTLPINLGFSNVTERFPNEEQNLAIVSDRFNLNILDPMLKDFDNLSGILKCNVLIGGMPRQPKYSGKISFTDTRFRLVQNNINYILNGELEPRGNQIFLKSFQVKNLPEKKLSGEANFSGSVSIQNFKISSFDVTANGQLLLMTDATRKVNPNMYGLLFTETSQEGLKLQGNLERPYLSGILYIVESNLTFPPTSENQSINSNLALRYIVIDDTTKKDITSHKISKFYSEIDSTEISEAISTSRRESPLLDRLRYNLSIEPRGLTALTMIFTPAGDELYAELGGKITAINDQGVPNLYGEIEISSRSFYNFIKKFDATGKLKFVGKWDNPELDIKAIYEGYRQLTPSTTSEATQSQSLPVGQQSTEQKVVVELKIGGTRLEPKISMSMKVQPKPGDQLVDWASEIKGSDVQSDAISFIMFGKFKDQLTSKEQQDFTNLGSATGTSVASSVLSSIVSDVIKKEFPAIRRVEVSYQGGNFQAGTSVNVSATAFKGYLRVGGRILNDIGNTNVSYQLSLGEFLNYVRIRNLYLEILRKVEGDNPDDRKLTNEARVFYRFSF